MKKYRSIFAGSAMVALLLSGCADKEQVAEKKEGQIEEVQKNVEPYEKAIEAINKNNMLLVEEYLQLTKADFPDSLSAFGADVLIALDAVTHVVTHGQLLEKMSAGMSHGSSLWFEEDVELLNSHLELLRTGYDSSYEQLEKTMQIVIDQYKAEDYSKLFEGLAIEDVDVGYYDDLEFFTSVGSPVPSAHDITEFLKLRQQEVFYGGLYYITDHLEQPELLFADLFMQAAVIIQDSNWALTEQLVDAVMEMTKDDPYNELRIHAKNLVAQLSNEEVSEGKSEPATEVKQETPQKESIKPAQSKSQPSEAIGDQIPEEKVYDILKDIGQFHENVRNAINSQMPELAMDQVKGAGVYNELVLPHIMRFIERNEIIDYTDSYVTFAEVYDEGKYALGESVILYEENAGIETPYSYSYVVSKNKNGHYVIEDIVIEEVPQF